MNTQISKPIDQSFLSGQSPPPSALPHKLKTAMTGNEIKCNMEKRVKEAEGLDTSVIKENTKHSKCKAVFVNRFARTIAMKLF